MTTISLSTAWTEQAPYQTALEARRRFEWSVFPLDEDKKPPKTGDFHPNGTPKRLGWKSLQSRRPSEQEISFWQTTYQPIAWAVITGAISGILILDFDGDAGKQTRLQLGLEPHVQTGSNGHHVYFKHPGWHVPTLNSKSKESLGKRWPGLDVRGDGGYAAFCGRNRHGPYLWLRELTLENYLILPEDLRAMIGLLQAPQDRSSTQKPPADAPASELAEPLLKRALHMIEHERAGRNNTGFWLACQLRDNGYPEEMAKAIMQRYVAGVPSTNSKGQEEPYTEDEALSSLRSAYARAARDAWTISTPDAEATPMAAGGGRGPGNPTTATTPSPESDDLPEILVGGEQLRDLTTGAIETILRQERKKPTLFLQSARLVRVGRNEVHRPIVAQMGVVEVREVLTHAANFYRLKKVSGSQEEYAKVPCSPPKELAEQILARQTQKPYLPFPPLVAIVETPVIRPDGSILDQPGYDPQTGLYYAPQKGMQPCRVPSHPSIEECQAALALIWDVIGEFPYVGAADKANTLGLLLTPIVRPAITRHVPLALIDAPKQGTGKGLLSDVVSIAATGSSAAILTLSESDEELQKAITALLIEGCTIITIDNIQGRLQSKHLDAVLTSNIWRGRILGQSKMTQVPQRATWIATGNNIRVGGDLARRCYRIRLDPKVSRPWMRRGFTHSDLATWVQEHRAELVSALLTLARAWFVAGCPQYDHLPQLGTFTGWVKVVGGILAYARVEGFLSNLEQLYDEADEESAQWEGFLKAWHETFRCEWVKIAEVVEWLQGTDEEAGSSDEGTGSSSHSEANMGLETLPEFLQIALKDRPKSFKIRLGKALEKRIDTCFGDENFHLERGRDTDKKVNRWRVCTGSPGRSPSHARDENHADDPLAEPDKNEREMGGKNSPYPHQPGQPPSGSTGALNPSSQEPATPTCSANQTALPVQGDQRERFEL